MTSAFPIPEAALAAHTAVLGKTGSGKTSTAKVIVEHLVATGARVCILDPIKSDWWGLTSSADGKRPGLPFQILGGPHGHVEIQASAGKAIGELVASAALPLSIIDMKNFGPGGQGRFFTEFAPALLNSMRGVVHLVMEEAHLFAPKERSGIGDENLAIHYAKMLATAGRSTGIRLILATQRTQALHNAMLGSCETMVAHRLTAPADQKPLVDWLKANVRKDIAQEVADSLSGLKTGTGWVCSGEAKFFAKVEFPRIATFDNSATPTGDLAQVKVQTAAVDVDKLRAIIGEAAAETAANDLALLKAENARLKALTSKPEVIANPAALRDADEQGYVRGFDAGQRVGRKEAIAQFGKAVGSLLDTMAAVAEVGAAEAAVAPPTPRPTAPVSRSVAVSRQPASGDLGAKAKVLQSLAWWKAAGFPAIDRPRACIMAGYSPKASTFGVYIGQLKEAGLISVPEPGKIALTPEGEAQAPTPDIASDLVIAARELLSAAEAKVFDAIVAAHPEAILRTDLADAVGLSRTASTLGVYIGKVASFGFITSGRGTVRAADWLFPEAK